MDERANGDPVERIAHAYREPLPEVYVAALEAGVAVPGFQIDGVCEALRDLITEQLTEPTFPACVHCCRSHTRARAGGGGGGGGLKLLQNVDF